MANKRIRTTVYGTTAPLDRNVAWIDTTDANSPVLKLYVNGEWQSVSGGGEGPEPPQPDPALSVPFTIEATLDDTTVYFRQSPFAVSDGLAPLKVDVSTDNGETWTEVIAAPAENEVPGEVLVALNAGDKVLIRGNNDAYGYHSGSQGDIVENCNFWADQPCYVYGNIMSLVSKDGFETIHSVGEYAFASFFSDYDEALDWSWVLSEDGEELLLPATVLSDNCYYGMFYNCTSLTTAPELPATTLAEYCYIYMFGGCTSLTTAPKLPATTLAYHCYSDMFRDCTSLASTPELPATTLVESCYSSMFKGCTSLTIAPELPATVLEYHCYWEMFKGCSNLSYIKALFTTTPSSNYTANWVEGVNAIGTFVKSTNATWNALGNNGVPSGWTVRTQSPAQRSDQADWEEMNSDKASYIWNKPTVPTKSFLTMNMDDQFEDVTEEQAAQNLHISVEDLNLLLTGHIFGVHAAGTFNSYIVCTTHDGDRTYFYTHNSENDSILAVYVLANNSGSITYSEI